ncbi:MAG: sulfatase-like hydrolase/transferase, partial [Candidatus Marinimicrobia bacterium]|nr:sulfatase-like hydrolase/transferase [Candidatus Neomarinimicrobiota bacterium]
IKTRNFAYLHYMEAHQRHTSKLKNTTFAELTNEQVQRGLDWSKLDACNRGTERKICQQYIIYTNAVLDLRDSIANTLETLESNGFLKDTLVVVYSDHGEEFHDHWAEAVADNTDPRGVHGFGHGNSMYQGQLRVPLLIWNPADNKGRIVDNPVSLVDITPSALNWLNVDSGEDTLAGLLLDDAEKLTERAVFASNMAYGPEQITVRQGSKKSIWNTVNDRLRFFDLTVDQNEKKPIKSDDLVMRFDQLNFDYFEMGSNGVGVQPEINQEQLAHLKAIGYLQGAQSNISDETITPDPTFDATDVSNAGSVDQTEMTKKNDDNDEKNHE